MPLQLKEVKRLAAEAGFDLCGATPAVHLADGEKRYREWLESGRGEGLDYLGNYLDLRFDASKLVEGAKSVIVCAVNYKSEYSLSKSECGVSSYALMRDYHKTIRRRLKGLLSILSREYGVSGRVFTDSAPLLEKELAVRAGLGWIGRQSLLVTPQFGTFVLLGELVIDAELDSYDTPLEGRSCGSCRSCLDSCPAQAINDNKTIDARRCIASRTIEFDDCGMAPLYGWVFGCDVCQSSCPHNQSTPIYINEDMRPIITPPSAGEWQAMSAEDYESFTAGTPMRRSSLERIKRAIECNKK